VADFSFFSLFLVVFSNFSALFYKDFLVVRVFLVVSSL
jgi:hypothetical protein